MGSDSTGASRSASSAGHASHATSTGGRTGSAKEEARFDRTVCAFWLGHRCFGLDVALVGEVVVVESFAPVPISRPSMRGLFNLRGMPVALVELASVVGAAETKAEDRKVTTALVLRSGDLLAGLIIDRVEAVIPAGRGKFSPPSENEENALVKGFLEVQGGKGGVVTVLEQTALVARLDLLRYVQGAGPDPQ
jgi:chemotaxis signal transduction protein